jgi:opacity protein-like surface antigen
MNIKLAAMLAAAVSIGVSHAASAADMPVKAPMVKAPAVVVAAGWSGCYIGAHGGFKRAKIKTAYGPNNLNEPIGAASSPDFYASSYEVGPTLGCNYQWDRNWVIGVEGDWAYTHLDGSAVETNFAPFQMGFREHWNATGRLRLGYAVDNILLYVTGGAAWASIEGSNFIPGVAGAFTSQRRTHLGWVAGGGAEFAVASAWSVKVEGLYMDLGTKSYLDALNPVSGAAYDYSVTQWVGRLGVNYKFWAGR